MSKIIKLTAEYIEECIRDFAETLQNAKIQDGKINYSRTLVGGGEKATLVFSPMAWYKMHLLIDKFDSEVGWHGTIERGENPREYVVTDILVYPQEVTGATVNTDQEGYQTWLDNLDDDTFNALHFHGHSHVNMGTSPSGVDIEHQASIIEQMRGDMFYVFVIWNKKGDKNIKIYDFKENTLFETSDVEVVVPDNELDPFLEEAMSLVKKKTYTYSNANKTKGSTNTYSTYTPKTYTPKDTEKKPVEDRGVSAYDDYYFSVGKGFNHYYGYDY